MKKIDSTIVNGSAQPTKKVVMAKMIASARASSHQSTRHCCFFSGGSGGLAGSSFSPSSQPLTNLRFHEASGGVYRLDPFGRVRFRHLGLYVAGPTLALQDHVLGPLGRLELRVLLVGLKQQPCKKCQC